MSGFDLQWVLSLDLLSFDSLIGSIDRETARQEYSRIVQMRLAVNGEGASFKEFMGKLEKRAAFTGVPQDDSKKLIQKFGKGI